MDDDDEKFAKALQHLLDHPEDRTEDIDRFIRGIVLDPRFHQMLVERAKRDDPEILNLLLAHARDPRPRAGRKAARKVLSEAWRDDDAIH